MAKLQIGELLTSKFAAGLIERDLAPKTYVTYAIVTHITDLRVTLLVKIENAEMKSSAMKLYTIPVCDYQRYTALLYRHVQYA